MLLRLILATARRAIMQSQNHFPEPNRQTLDFLHPIFTLQDHMPSTTGYALKSLISSLNSCSFGVFHPQALVLKLRLASPAL
jgi:hypothetical protein